MRTLCAFLMLICSAVCAETQYAAAYNHIECLEKEVTELASHPQLIAGINNYNSSPPNPQQMDKIWNSLKPEDQRLGDIINNPSADEMRDWIKHISIQGEGLLIGRNGGLVAATEKTTDFWQGDEAQFLQAIGLTAGQVYVQSEMLDESTHLMLIKISAPVYNPRSRHPIGVLVIGFDQFVIDFIEPCKHR
ncbi:MAG: hypothetical protein CMK83_18625 [Pseudomonadales bacterium]|jgi:hypothetical protein|uniref:hypothetical protein n=1 Tax=unclassified Ketobacter TaxID=2639109 RepID=UPI000C8C71DF|nr:MULTISPECIES: hypothetical protein [unclassified Ketobacter]MAQ26224.1 hypothetical protein [Pseudomonadales bacterium]MEC8809913.1 hypothetical protein [Pseudomonadota bacterium]TNC90343.1 MAG: hypothetical protein CSH49_03135 [Alcanivorax sp.]HAG93618.1 hypothetical protein [Gammaproteobacteria bacterium]RLT89955.1 MAG: hypothetical protein D9N13_09985 [Ketobacter sp. GenoA1]